jgi:hypothetical protein
MIVAAIVVCILARLLCWTLLRLDANAKLHSTLVDARTWKAINIKFQIERDTGTPHSATEHPPTVAIIDEPDQPNSSTAATSLAPASQPAARTPGPHQDQPANRHPVPDDAVAVARRHNPPTAARATPYNLVATLLAALRAGSPALRGQAARDAGRQVVPQLGVALRCTAAPQCVKHPAGRIRRPPADGAVAGRQEIGQFQRDARSRIAFRNRQPPARDEGSTRPRSAVWETCRVSAKPTRTQVTVAALGACSVGAQVAAGSGSGLTLWQVIWMLIAGSSQSRV